MNTSYIDLEIYNSIGEILGDELPLLVEEFIEDSLVKLEELKKYMKENDADKIFNVSHSLKSSSANMGAIPMSEICQSIETESRNGSTASALEFISSLEEMLKNTSNELRLLVK